MSAYRPLPMRFAVARYTCQVAVPRRPAIHCRAGYPGAVRAGDDEEGASGHGATGRDVLGEMEIAARVMITGGDAGEDARMSRADRLLIRNAILLAAKTGARRKETHRQVITRGCGRGACELDCP